MKKKRILIASIIFILITCIVTAVFIIKNKNRSTSNTVYTYSNVNPDYNYSEDTVSIRCNIPEPSRYNTLSSE